MSFPAVTCVTCKSHTDALDRHAIQLPNNRRALKGICPICATETYRFMPLKEGQPNSELSLISSQRRLPKNALQAAGAKTLKAKDISEFSTLATLTRIEHIEVSLGEKLLHYGILLVIFGLSIAIGFVICTIILK